MFCKEPLIYYVIQHGGGGMSEGPEYYGKVEVRTQTKRRKFPPKNTFVLMSDFRFR